MAYFDFIFVPLFSIFPYSLSLAVKKFWGKTHVIHLYSIVAFFIVNIEQHRWEKRLSTKYQSNPSTQPSCLLPSAKNAMELLCSMSPSLWQPLEDQNAFHYYFSKAKESIIRVMLTLQKRWCFIVVWEKEVVVALNITLETKVYNALVN